MTIAWGDIGIHEIIRDDGDDDIIAGSEFELLAEKRILSGLIGKALVRDYDADEYEAILRHEGFGFVIGFAKDDVITIAGRESTNAQEFQSHATYIVDSYRAFLRRRAQVHNMHDLN